MNRLNTNERPLVIGPSCKRKITVGIAAGILTLLAGPAFAFSDVFFKSGTVDAYDFGTVHGEYIGIRPAFVVIEGFTMRPGDSVGWHYHKGTSYIIIANGTITEQDVEQNTNCSSRQDTGGSAFVEPPGKIHNVTNNGPGVAIIWWATIFPQSDGIQSDGTYYVDPPGCN